MDDENNFYNVDVFYQDDYLSFFQLPKKEVAEGEEEEDYVTMREFDNINDVYEMIVKEVLVQNPTSEHEFYLNKIPEFCRRGKDQILKNLSLFIEKMENNSIDSELYNCLSCVLGAFLGDAIGSYVEFKKPNKENHLELWGDVNRKWKTRKGQLTDDSEMAMSIAYALLSNEGYMDTNSLAFFYQIWRFSCPIDIGGTVSRALTLKDIKRAEYNEEYTKKNLTAAESNKGSLSNGYLMKRTPISIWIYICFKDAFHNKFNDQEFKDFYKLDILTGIDIKLTHCNIECQVTANIYDFIIFNILLLKSENIIDQKRIMNTVWSRTGIYLNQLKELIEDPKVPDKMINLYNMMNSKNFQNKEEGEKSVEEIQIGVINISYYYHSFYLFFYFMKYFKFYVDMENPYDYMMNFMCDLGGDTDTNCCIVGGIIGACVGYSNLPQKKVNDMMNCFIIDNFGSRIDYSRTIFSPGMIVFVIDNLYKLLLEKKKSMVVTHLDDLLKNLKGNASQRSNFKVIELYLNLAFKEYDDFMNSEEQNNNKRNENNDIPEKEDQNIKENFNKI